jgi:hypothetical protein
MSLLHLLSSPVKSSPVQCSPGIDVVVDVVGIDTAMNSMAACNQHLLAESSTVRANGLTVYLTITSSKTCPDKTHENNYKGKIRTMKTKTKHTPNKTYA